MIPYFDGHLFTIAGQPIYMFGVLVALGVIIGDRIVPFSDHEAVAAALKGKVA